MSKNYQYSLRPEVSNQSGSVFSAMLCKGKSAKSKIKYHAAILHPLLLKVFKSEKFPLLFPTDCESLKTFLHTSLGSGGQKEV